MANIVNLTPHPIRIRKVDGEFLELPKPSGPIPRCSTSDVVIGEVNGVQLSKSELGQVVDLPESAPDTIYVVSRVVLQAAPEREDLFAPGTLLRDDNGAVVGAAGLSR